MKIVIAYSSGTTTWRLLKTYQSWPISTLKNSPLSHGRGLKFNRLFRYCICAVGLKILICHMTYLEQLWSPPPPLTSGDIKLVRVAGYLECQNSLNSIILIFLAKVCRIKTFNSSLLSRSYNSNLSRVCSGGSQIFSLGRPYSKSIGTVGGLWRSKILSLGSV